MRWMPVARRAALPAAAGAQTAARDLEVLATCKAGDVWPGYSDQIEPISLPPWMRPGSNQQQPPTEIELY